MAAVSDCMDTTAPTSAAIWRGYDDLAGKLLPNQMLYVFVVFLADVLDQFAAE